MTGLDMAGMMMRHIADYRAEEAAMQRKQALHHERAMTLEPGTPERNTVDGLVSMALGRKNVAKAGYMALARLARATEFLTEEQIAEAISEGRKRAA